MSLDTRHARENLFCWGAVGWVGTRPPKVRLGQPLQGPSGALEISLRKRTLMLPRRKVRVHRPWNRSRPLHRALKLVLLAKSVPTRARSHSGQQVVPRRSSQSWHHCRQALEALREEWSWIQHVDGVMFRYGFTPPPQGALSECADTRSFTGLKTTCYMPRNFPVSTGESANDACWRSHGQVRSWFRQGDSMTADVGLVESDDASRPGAEPPKIIGENGENGERRRLRLPAQARTLRERLARCAQRVLAVSQWLGGWP